MNVGVSSEIITFVWVFIDIETFHDPDEKYNSTAA